MFQLNVKPRPVMMLARKKIQKAPSKMNFRPFENEAIVPVGDEVGPGGAVEVVAGAVGHPALLLLAVPQRVAVALQLHRRRPVLPNLPPPQRPGRREEGGRGDGEEAVGRALGGREEEVGEGVEAVADADGRQPDPDPTSVPPPPTPSISGRETGERTGRG